MRCDRQLSQGKYRHETSFSRSVVGRLVGEIADEVRKVFEVRKKGSDDEEGYLSVVRSKWGMHWHDFGEEITTRGMICVIVEQG